MDIHQLEALLRSWGRMAPERARKALPSLSPDVAMSATDAGEAVCRLYGEALGMSVAEAAALHSMSLEMREPGQDPLQPGEAFAFAALLGSTVGWHTTDGYLNFGEAVGRAMVRARERAEAGQPRLDACRLELHGEQPVGVLEATDAEGRAYAFFFTRSGAPVRRGGMVRTCALPAASMFGMGCVLEGSHAEREIRAANAPASTSASASRAKAPRPQGSSRKKG